MSEPRKLYTGSASGGLDQEQYEAARRRAQQLAEQNARRRTTGDAVFFRHFLDKIRHGVHGDDFAAGDHIIRQFFRHNLFQFAACKACGFYHALTNVECRDLSGHGTDTSLSSLSLSVKL